ncbi:MAG: hypothetical protein QF535_01280 [Anaerolineales bacterium]|nr:hypothetical protein [Anaerolineales bacterium]
MPYTIGKKGTKFVVRKKHGGKVMGTHSSKKKAKAQQAAIYANESYPDTPDAVSTNMDIFNVDRFGEQEMGWDQFADRVDALVAGRRAIRNAVESWDTGEIEDEVAVANIRNLLANTDARNPIDRRITTLVRQWEKGLDAETVMITLKGLLGIR